MSSSFDDLLNFGDTSGNTNQSADPFDPLGSNQSGGSSGGDLLDLGFDAQISTQNGNSGKVNFEANTNPLYELSNSENTMESEASNLLFDLNAETQKEAKMESGGNPLYDFHQSENTNGHSEVVLTNGGTQNDVDLLALSGDVATGAVTSDDSGVTLDSNNLNESNPEAEPEQEPEEQVEEEVQEEVEKEGEVIQERSRTNSEASEPEEQKQVDEPLEQNGTELSEGTTEISDQAEGPEAADVGKEDIPVHSELEKEEEGLDVANPESTIVEENRNEPAAACEEAEQGSVKEQNAEQAVDTEDMNGNQEPVENEAVRQEVEKAEEPSIQDEGVITAETEPEVQAVESPDPQVPQDETVEQADNIEKEHAASQEVIPEKEPEPSHEEEEEVKDFETAADDFEAPPENPEPVSTEPEQVLEETNEQPNVVNEEKPEQAVIEDKVEAELAVEESEKPEQPMSEPVEVEKAAPEQVEDEQEPALQEEQAPVPEPEPVEEVKPEVEAVETQPDTQPLEVAVETPDVGNEDQKEPESQAGETTEAGDTEPAENGVAKVNGTSEVKENGVSEEEAVRDPSIFRETREKEEIHFAELNNFREKFESGKIEGKEPEPKKSVKDEYDAGGEYENEPVQNPDVVREADEAAQDLPEAGTAKNLLDKFKSIQEEKAQTVRSQKRESPLRQVEKVEYESTPDEHLVIEEGKSDMGEFESQPEQPEGVVRSGDVIEDAQPEKGYAKNIMNKFKEIQSGAPAPQPRERREITPDKSGKVEYVSEPRGQKIVYDENRFEAGVFENQPKGEEEEVVRSDDKPQEVMPESGTAKNLLSKFKQMESEVGNRPPPSPKREVREITPDRSGKVEYVSEPRREKIEYEEQKEDQGIFESKPAEVPEVVRSGETVEDFKPEAGTAKKTLERYKEMQKQASSPVSSSPRKEITPPRDTTSPGKTVHGVVENTPSAAKDDVIRSGDRLEDELPEQGSAKNILNKFREIQSAGNSPAESPTKKIKEFTPPPEAGVYENTPDEHLVIEPQQSFEGILESTPTKSVADVARDHEQSPEKELPETGMAKNLVSKFRQLETTSAKTSTSSSPRFKEFTPPRDRGPLSPKSPAGGPSDGVNLSDLPGQYQQQDKPGVYENEPELKPDVVRETDTDWTVGMPAPNTTSSMLQRFRSIQDQAKEDQKTPAPVSRKEKGMFKVVQTEKCDACQKTVYAMEKLEMNGHVYHKNCFKCSHCSARLTPKTFSMNEGVIYCVNHFKQLFARKGNYDEGFGRQQYKKKWGSDTNKEVATA